MTKPLRTRLTHLHDLSLNEWEVIRAAGRFTADITEKTDGFAWEFGCDEDGLYSRTSYSPKMRVSGNYLQAAKVKFGNQCDPSISKPFDNTHFWMSFNPEFTQYLLKHRASIVGEMFYIGMNTHIPGKGNNPKVFVATEYDGNLMGKYGMFVMHSKHSANKHHTYELISSFTDLNVVYDDDKVAKQIDVDVGGTLVDFEQSIREQLSTIQPKWGKETEGYVIHSHNGLPSFKVIDKQWAERKRARYNKSPNGSK